MTVFATTGPLVELLPSVDQDFEASIGDWIANSGLSSVAQSATQAHGGTKAARATNIRTID